MKEDKRVSSSFAKKGDRQSFTVELRPGETTIVSWKKLLKDANKHDGSASDSQHPPIAPGEPVENEENDAAQPSRFSALIEKIERLYKGKDSSDDEDLLDVPDDDQYDTEDSFIDDAELDEYFKVDNSAIKHDGFFVNRGQLERTDEAPVLPIQQPKKRRKKDILKNPGENNDNHGSNKHVKVGKPASGKTASIQAKNVCETLKHQNQLDVYGVSSKIKKSDAKPMLDSSVTFKASSDDVPAPVREAKDADKQNIGAFQSKNTSDKYKYPSGSFDASHQKYHEKSLNAQSKSQPGRPSKNTDDLENIRRSKEKNGMRELPDLNLSVGKSATQATTKSEYMHKKDGSCVRPKTSMLEKALRELEKMVAESRPPAVENQEVDNASQAVKRRLPREIKLKLAKVARLAASHGKVSKELVNRLMSILGHLIQLRTLKRHLKIMISMGLSVKQEEDDRFRQIKKEVVDMIKMQAPALESKQQQKAGASGDFQECGPDGKPITKKFTMDAALEDKICDLYDLFVDGLDENAGPQIRKFYAELAGLWPTGHMDNHGIKRGICRAKERRKALYCKNKDQEKIKRKKLLVPKQEEGVQADAGSIISQHSLQERLAPESSSHVLTSMNKLVSNTNTAVRVPSPMNGLKHEKAKASSSSSLDDVRVADGVLTKKVKRKPELELDGASSGSEKLASLQGEERAKSQKQSSGLEQSS